MKPLIVWPFRFIGLVGPWLMLTVGFFLAFCGIILQTDHFVWILPKPIQTSKILSPQDWLLLVVMLVGEGGFIIYQSQKGERRKIAWSLLILVIIGTPLAWWEFKQYLPGYQIEVIRGNRLLGSALADSDPRRNEVGTNWAVALAYDKQSDLAIKVADAVSKNGTDSNPRLIVAQTLERAEEEADAKTAWAAAAAAARGLSGADAQCLALARLVRAEIVAGRNEEAIKIADEARGKAKSSVSRSTLVEVLVSYGQAMSRDRKHEEAKESWKEAIRIADSEVKEFRDRYLAFADVARGTASVGEYVLALEALEQCRTLAVKVTGQPVVNPDALAEEVTNLFIGEGRIEQAKDLAYTIQRPDNRARSLISSAIALRNENRSEDENRAWEGAIAACSTSLDHESLALANAAVARALDLRGTDVRPYWSTALLEMRRVPDPRRLYVLCKIAEELVRSGHPDRALLVARTVPVPSERSVALTRVGEAFPLAKVDQLKFEDLEPADVAASAIVGDQWRSPALAAVAKGLARLKRFREARLKASECRRSMDELDAYASIMIEYHGASQQ